MQRYDQDFKKTIEAKWSSQFFQKQLKYLFSMITPFTKTKIASYLFQHGNDYFFK